MLFSSHDLAAAGDKGVGQWTINYSPPSVEYKMSIPDNFQNNTKSEQVPCPTGK